MSAFDKIIGYESVKAELTQICDMFHNKSIYENLGAKLPQGVLLYGKPGLGKTLMSKCLVEESGLNVFTIRRNQGSNKFVEKITGVFEEAKKNAPSVIFLDDMDKFANEDERHRDAEEYVAIQAGIDEIKGMDILVVATANDIDKLPDSLLRSGRFDRKIEIRLPSEKDSDEIIKHYLKSKRVAENVNYEDITKMISYSSCADLETIMNEAAINAGFAKRESISMEDIVKAVLRMEYNSPDTYTKATNEDLRKTAIHEAGHLVVCEVLCPESVGIASIRANGRDRTDGFIRRCKDLPKRPHHALVSLGGKAAVELYYSEGSASGCGSDLRKAYRNIRIGIADEGTNGLGLVDVGCIGDEISESMNARTEAVVYAELEKYMFKVKDILIKNKIFLEKTIESLLEKETLLYSDIQRIRQGLMITDIAV